jgi:hypothetical protein
MTPFNKKGPGAPTHVLVDMLGHPAVELTQAEDAVGSGARADLATPAAVSGSEDILVLVDISPTTLDNTQKIRSL